MGASEDQLIEAIAGFSADPLGFVQFCYPWQEQGELEKGIGPRTWQAEILEAIGEHLSGPQRFEPLQISVASGHGIGKSALISWILHWGLSTCEDCKAVVTANTGTQLSTKTWPEISKWFRLGINAHWWRVRATGIDVKDAAHEETWRADAITWSENNTEAFAGLHNKGKRIIVLYDEASAIADRVWEVTEGALTDEETEIIWVTFGNPTQNTGRFRECFGRYKHRWIRRQIDSRTVEGTNKKQFAKWVEDYGEDSDFCRVRIRGEFPRAGSTQFIAGDVVAAARHRTVEIGDYDQKILSVDVARFGDDQTIIGMRQGPKAQFLEKLRGQDTIQVAIRVCGHMRRELPRATIIDADGLGAGVVDYIRHEMRQWLQEHPLCKVEEFHGGYAASNSRSYFNLRAEAWGRMRQWLKTGSIPDDAELEADLTGPEYFFSSKNQIQLEKKEDMKKRGLSSPDNADMLAMTFFAHPVETQYEEMNAEDAAFLARADKQFQERR